MTNKRAFVRSDGEVKQKTRESIGQVRLIIVNTCRVYHRVLHTKIKIFIGV